MERVRTHYCHLRTNKNRDFWKNFFTELLYIYGTNNKAA